MVRLDETEKQQSMKAFKRACKTFRYKQELAKALGISNTVLWQYQRGERYIAPALVVKICELANYTVLPHELRPDVFKKNPVVYKKMGEIMKEKL